MRNGKIILSLILLSCILSCNYSRKKLTYNNEKEEVMRNDSIISDFPELKNFFVPYGNDSLLMIPDWTLANLHESPLEPYHKLYASYREFENDFLHNPDYLSERLKWSYHFRSNKMILQDYSNMSFDDFLKKYTRTEGPDTILLTNDTTLAFCFDKHGYYCVFNYQNTGKTKMIQGRN